MMLQYHHYAGISIMARPRILLFSTAYAPLIGGSELALQHIVARLPQYDFDLVTSRPHRQVPAMEVIGGVRVFRAGGWLSRVSLGLPKVFLPLAMAWTAFRLLRKHSYAFLHVYQASQAAGAAWLVKILFPRISFLLTLQEGKDLQRQSLLIRVFRLVVLARVTRVTAISTSLATYARRYTSAPIDIIPNGVDTKAFAASGPRVYGHTIVSVSRLVPKNGVIYLIRALPHVLRVVPDARLVLIGDGPLRSSLELLAADLHVVGAVTFVGSVPHADLPHALEQANVFVRPSLSEGLGTAFLEAMAAGLPIIGSRVGGIQDFLQHEKTGLVCVPNDPEDIARQIIRVFQDEAFASRLADQGRALVQQRYDWEHVAHMMADVYDQLVSNNQHMP